MEIDQIENRRNSLTKQDITELVEAMQGHTMSSSERITDNFMKLAIGLITVGIIWIMTSINEMKNEQVRSEEWRIMNTRQLDKMEEFMGIPRFTKSDFDASMQPFIYDTKNNAREISRLSEKIVVLRESIDKVEQAVNGMKQANR